MSLWDWLLAAWIYEELFDDDSDTTSHDNTRDYDSSYDNTRDYDSSYDNTRDYDSSYDYDDYEEDF